MAEAEDSPSLLDTNEKPELPKATERHTINATATVPSETEEPSNTVKQNGSLDGETAKDTPDNSKVALKSVNAPSTEVAGSGQNLPEATNTADEQTSPSKEEEPVESVGKAGPEDTSKSNAKVHDEEVNEEPKASSHLGDDFEELSVDDLNDISLEDHQENKEIGSDTLSKHVDHSRPGVTSDPPKPSNKLSGLTSLESQDSPTSLSASKRSASIADELAQAEEAADSAALSASQRGTLGGKRSAPALDLPPEDQSTFTEENLQSGHTSPMPVPPFSPPPVPTATFNEAERVDSSEPEEYRGLVYNDGVDSQGRPVIVINADALSPKASRNAACAYLLQRLEPIILQGPYVAVFLSTGTKSSSNKLTAGWLASCYRQMSYPFKKNVKFVVLVRPSVGLNLLLTLVRPLIKKKAWAKIKKVDKLSAIEDATNKQVSLQHLGSRFTTIAGESIIKAEGASFGRGAAYQMPNIPGGL